MSHGAHYTVTDRGWYVDCDCGWSSGPYGERIGAEEAMMRHRMGLVEPVPPVPPDYPDPPW